jgi:hypothetical protein
MGDRFQRPEIVAIGDQIGVDLICRRSVDVRRRLRPGLIGQPPFEFPLIDVACSKWSNSVPVTVP